MSRWLRYSMLVVSLGCAAGWTASDAWAADAPPPAHGVEAHDEAPVKDPSLLSIQPGAYFWQILLFLILFAVLAKFVWPVILKGLREREDKIRDDLQRAEDAAREATTTLEQYKQQLAEAQIRAQETIEKSRGEAEQLAARIKADADAELERLRQRASDEIASAKQQALSELYTHMATLSSQVAGKILHREINPQDHQELVQQSLSKLSDARRN